MQRLLLETFEGLNLTDRQKKIFDDVSVENVVLSSENKMIDIYLVSSMEAGTVTTNTSTNIGDIMIIITREPITVIRLVHIWSRSFDREAFTVSTS